MKEMAGDVLLEAVGISKSFPGVRALDDVSLRVRSGRMLALLGENGAGKSTLMNVLSGVLSPDAGVIRLGATEPVRFENPHAAQQHGIGIVHQELNLIPDLSIAENIWLGREPLTPAGLIDYDRLNADTVELLTKLDLRAPPNTLVSTLRLGQQQLVEIGKALSAQARVLILDEPTSSLSAHEVEVLFRVITDLKRRGVGIVYITHKFEELASLCDEVVIMRDGRVVETAPYADLTRERIVQLMAGRESKSQFQKSPVTLGQELLRVENLTLTGDGSGRRVLVSNVSLRLMRGEVLGIFGLVGAGRTELLEAIFGLHDENTEGALFVEGSPVHFRSPADAIAAGIAFAPEDRKRDGLVLPLSVFENGILASLDRAVRASLVSESLVKSHLSPYFERFRVKTPSGDEPVVNLSGGNQQKVILAKWMATQPKILLLDEPTRGIDVNAKREIYAFIDELAAAGLGLIVVSSELPEVLALADRVLVLCEGRATALFNRADATPERVLQAALPDRSTVCIS